MFGQVRIYSFRTWEVGVVSGHSTNGPSDGQGAAQGGGANIKFVGWGPGQSLEESRQWRKLAYIIEDLGARYTEL